MAPKTRTVRQIMAEAETAQKAGDLQRAAALYAGILSRMPGHGGAKKALRRLQRQMGIHGGALTQAEVNELVRLFQSGRPAAAADMARLLLGKAPKEPVLHNILGMALVQQGQMKDAAAAFRAATRLRPGFAEAHGNLGGVLLQLGQPEQALAALDRAIAIKPDLVEAHQNRGIALTQIGRLSEALESTEQALALDPRHATALNSKATILKDLNKTQEAIACFEQALEIDPDNPVTLTNLAYAHDALDQTERAVGYLRRAVELAPDNSETWYRLGVQLSALGRLDEALDALTRACEIDPDNAEAWRTITTLKRFRGDEPEIARMEQALAKAPPDSAARMHLGFALGKTREDTGDHDAAFEHWREANAIRRRDFDYDIAMHEEQAARIKRIFDADFLAAHAGAGNPSRKPVLIVGMMRSGTTLAERIIASHSQAAGAGEQTLVTRFGEANLDRFEHHPFPDLTDFATDYLARLDRYGPQAARVVDKMPANFFWLGLVRTAFPNATIINMQRDPRDICLSIWKNHFSTHGHAYAYDLGELARFYLIYRDLMDHWESTLPGGVYNCSYEELTRNPRDEARRLLDACGLEWDPAVLEFHKAKGVVKTASVGQVRERIYQSSVRGWKRYERQLAPLVEILERAGRL